MLTCCFTGHRPRAFPWGEDESDERFCALVARIGAEVDGLIACGVTRFICGNALGVDTWAAEVVLAKKAEHPGIKLEVAVPFEGHNAGSERVRAVQERADDVHVVSHAPDKMQAYDERNRYMVDHSDVVVAVFDERATTQGGTARTVAYAREQQKEIIQFRWTML